MKLAIVGTSISLYYLPYFKDYGIEVTALCATPRSHEKTIQLCKDYNIEKAYDDYDEMIEEGGFDTVYVSVNNHLHYPFTKKALEKGYHCIVEKPFMSTAAQTEELIELAKKKELFLFEFSRVNYTANFKAIKEHLPEIGKIKSAIISRGQYSRRYDAFLNGEILPVFDKNKSGGALMDLNVYLIHYAVDLFGKPLECHYYPVIEKGIDISGKLILVYDGFTVLCSANKDSNCEDIYHIYGINGWIKDVFEKGESHHFEVSIRNGETDNYNFSSDIDDLMGGFTVFKKMLEENNHQLCDQYLERTLTVSQIMTKVRLDNGIIFPDDNI